MSRYRIRQTKISRSPPKQECKTRKAGGLNIAAPICEVGHNAPQARYRRTLFTSALQRVQISLAKTIPQARLITVWSLEPRENTIP
jgi:hypothetical protein